MRHVIRVGQVLTVVTVPLEKWKRKGHQFIRLYVGMMAEDRVMFEVEHTAIFRIAGMPD